MCLPSFPPSPPPSTVDVEDMYLSPSSVKNTVGDSGHMPSPFWGSWVSNLLNDWDGGKPGRGVP